VDLPDATFQVPSSSSDRLVLIVDCERAGDSSIADTNSSAGTSSCTG
jgi:hypothetical protein